MTEQTNKPTKTTFNFRIETKTIENFKDLAKANQTTATALLTNWINEYIENCTDSTDSTDNQENKTVQTVSADNETTDIVKVSDALTDKFNELWETINHQQGEIEKLQHRQQRQQRLNQQFEANQKSMQFQIEKIDSEKGDRAFLDGLFCSSEQLEKPIETKPTEEQLESNLESKNQFKQLEFNSEQLDQSNSEKPKVTLESPKSESAKPPIEKEFEDLSEDEKIKQLARNNDFQKLIAQNKYPHKIKNKLIQILKNSGLVPQNYKLQSTEFKKIQRGGYSKDKKLNEKQKQNLIAEKLYLEAKDRATNSNLFGLI